MTTSPGKATSSTAMTRRNRFVNSSVGCSMLGTKDTGQRSPIGRATPCSAAPGASCQRVIAPLGTDRREDEGSEEEHGEGEPDRAGC